MNKVKFLFYKILNYLLFHQWKYQLSLFISNDTFLLAFLEPEDEELDLKEMNDYLDKAERDEEAEIEEEELRGKDYLIEKMEYDEELPGIPFPLINLFQMIKEQMSSKMKRTKPQPNMKTFIKMKSNLKKVRMMKIQRMEYLMK